MIQRRRGVAHERLPIRIVDQLASLVLIVGAGSFPVVTQSRIALQPREQIVGGCCDRLVAAESVIETFHNSLPHVISLSRVARSAAADCTERKDPYRHRSQVGRPGPSTFVSTQSPGSATALASRCRRG